jgi:hypothetical protein
MDSTALTTAWLDAAFRVRSAAYQDFVQQVPQAKAPRTDRTLTDTIESALQDAGAKPLPTINPAAPSEEGSATADQHVDRLA